MKKLSLAFLIVILLAIPTLSNTVHAETVPTISILGVTEDKLVTIKTFNFPAKKDFAVRMGKFGTKGVDGILAGTVNSGAGGTLIFTLPIPAALTTEKTIAIRLESTTSKHYAYNWFSNTTFGTHQGGVPADETSSTPTMTVPTVKKDTYIVLKGSGFKPDESLNVLMGKYGTEGVNGTLAEKITANEKGAFINLIDIPASFKSESKIAIRIESNDTDTEIYTWFKNETGASGGSDGSGSSDAYKGIPTISIVSVKEDDEVTIQTHNFPAGKEFSVLMGPMGTRGVGGTLVTKIDSGSGGSFSKTFDIPAGLKGKYQIAIRLQTANGHFYAYNWFYNNTASVVFPPGYTGIPTFTISSVVKDKTVTIKTNNFPKDIDFKVLMGKMGTRGIGGTYVETIDSGSGGSFAKTFAVPASLAGDYRIAIRLEAVTGGFYAYNWFYNNTYP